MARVTHVAKAQQRFHTRPVIDPATGEQKRTPVMATKKVWNELTEEYETKTVQKTTKTGRLVFMDVTEADKSRPKEPLSCDFRGCTITDGKILPGQAYKHISPKSGPYGGRQLSRHEEHASWHVWEYSSSLSARLEEIAFNFWEEQGNWESPDDVQSALDSAAEEITSIAEEKRESASNIEDGFGHPTSASEELEQVADDLESWADEVSAADIPDPSDYPCGNCQGDGEADCDACDGTGQIDTHEGDIPVDGQQETCKDCKGSGTVDCTECDEDHLDMDAWREAVQDQCSIIDESPV